MTDPYADLSDPAPVRLPDEDIQWLMSTHRGRRVMMQFVEHTAQEVSSFHPDVAVMAFNEGRRFVGIELLATIRRLCPEQEAIMRLEKTL